MLFFSERSARKNVSIKVIYIWKTCFFASSYGTWYAEYNVICTAKLYIHKMLISGFNYQSLFVAGWQGLIHGELGHRGLRLLWALYRDSSNSFLLECVNIKCSVVYTQGLYHMVIPSKLLFRKYSFMLESRHTNFSWQFVTASDISIFAQVCDKE